MSGNEGMFWNLIEKMTIEGSQSDCEAIVISKKKAPDHRNSGRSAQQV